MNTETGRDAENRAARFLQNKGYAILSRNYRCGKLGEIDIVAKQKDTLVFVEVKSKKEPFSFGTPQEAVTFKKQQTLVRLAHSFMQSRKLIGIPCRFDVVAISYLNQNINLEHFQNAFEAR